MTTILALLGVATTGSMSYVNVKDANPGHFADRPHIVGVRNQQTPGITKKSTSIPNKPPRTEIEQPA